jgi:hypothetical protein
LRFSYSTELKIAALYDAEKTRQDGCLFIATTTLFSAVRGKPNDITTAVENRRGMLKHFIIDESSEKR